MILSIVLPILSSTTETLYSDFTFPIKFYIDKKPNESIEKPDGLFDIFVATKCLCSQSEDFS